MERRDGESNWAHACRVLGLGSHRVAADNAGLSPGEAAVPASTDDSSFSSDHNIGGWQFGDPSESRGSVSKEGSIADCHPSCSQ